MLAAAVVRNIHCGLINIDYTILAILCTEGLSRGAKFLLLELDEGIENIIGCLSDTASGKTITLSKKAVDAYNAEATAIPFGLTCVQEGANITLADNGDGTATLNGTIVYDTYCDYGAFSSTYSAGAYTFNVPQIHEGTIHVDIFNLDGERLDFFTGWDAFDGTRSFVSDVDFVVKTQLYLIGSAAYSNTVIAYPTINPDFEGLKATKPNWTITLV